MISEVSKGALRISKGFPLGFYWISKGIKGFLKDSQWDASGFLKELKDF